MVAEPRPEPLAALARAAGRGEKEAFEQLVARTTPAVFALALRLVGNEQDALDVVQETYLRAFRSIEGFRGDAAVTTWLYRIAANCSTTYRIRRASRRHDPLDEAMTVVETRRERDPQATLESTDDLAALGRAIAELPLSLRSVVVLRDLYDLPHEAIAEELGISRAAAKVRLHRGRRKLRELLYPVAEFDGRTDPGRRVPASVTSIGRGADGGRAAIV